MNKLVYSIYVQIYVCMYQLSISNLFVISEFTEHDVKLYSKARNCRQDIFAA